MDLYGTKVITLIMIIMVTLGAGGSTFMQEPWQLYLFWGVIIGAGYLHNLAGNYTLAFVTSGFFALVASGFVLKIRS